MRENNLAVDCEILSGDKMCEMPFTFCYSFFTTLTHRVIGVAHDWCAFLHAFGNAFIQRGAHVGRGHRGQGTQSAGRGASVGNTSGGEGDTASVGASTAAQQLFTEK
jgi:hypothetical protein